MTNGPNNILIIKPSSLGDIIQALPALSALRKTWPNANISWLIRPEFMPLIKNHPHLTSVIPFDRKFLGKAWYNPHAFSSLIDLISTLRKNRFDAVLDLQGLFRTASLSWLSGCRNRYGMTQAREFAAVFYTHKVKQDKDCIHLVDYYLKICSQLGADISNPHFILPVEQDASDWTAKMLQSNNIKPSNYAVFVPGSAHMDKCWPLEHFAAMAQKLSEQFNFSILATGSSSEKELTGKLSTLTKVPVLDLAGKTTLPQLTAILKSAAVVISNDTGPGHIASALNVPVVLIFGRSNPTRVAPYGKPNCVVAVEPNSRGFAPDSYDPKYDIKNITVEDVFKSVCQQIKK